MLKTKKIMATARSHEAFCRSVFFKSHRSGIDPRKTSTKENAAAKCLVAPRGGHDLFRFQHLSVGNRARPLFSRRAVDRRRRGSRRFFLFCGLALPLAPENLEMGLAPRQRVAPSAVGTTFVF